MPPILANYHTHTSRCKHAVGTDRDYVESALAGGYQVLGFTDHVAWPFENGFVSPVRMLPNQMPEYAASVRALEEEYAGRIKLHLGAECEYFPDYFPWLREEAERLGLDYLILGVHFPPNEEGYPQYAYVRTPRELEEYTELSLAGMETGLFAYFCHPDLPLSSYPAFDSHALKLCETICQAAKRLDLPLEYNLLGLHRRSRATGLGYTRDEFWQVAASCGCTAIVGVDAHKPGILADPAIFLDARRRLEGWGLKVLDTLPGL